MHKSIDEKQPPPELSRRCVLRAQHLYRHVSHVHMFMLVFTVLPLHLPHGCLCCVVIFSTSGRLSLNNPPFIIIITCVCAYIQT